MFYRNGFFVRFQAFGKKKKTRDHVKAAIKCLVDSMNLTSYSKLSQSVFMV